MKPHPTLYWYTSTFRVWRQRLRASDLLNLLVRDGRSTSPLSRGKCPSRRLPSSSRRLSASSSWLPSSAARQRETAIPTWATGTKNYVNIAPPWRVLIVWRAYTTDPKWCVGEYCLLSKLICYKNRRSFCAYSKILMKTVVQISQFVVGDKLVVQCWGVLLLPI